MAADDEIRLGDAVRRLFGFMEPARRREFFLVVVVMVLGAVAELAAIASVLPLLSQLAGSSGTSLPGGIIRWAVQWGGFLDQSPVLSAALLFAVVAVVAGAVRLLLVWLTQRFTLDLAHDLAMAVQRRILYQPYRFHTERNSSQVLAAIENVDVLITSVLLQLMQAAAAAVIALAIIVALTAIDPLTALSTAAAVGSLYLLVSTLGSGRLRRNSRAAAKAYGERFQLLQESLGGIRDVIIDHSQNLHLDAYRTVDLRYVQARASTAFVGAAPRIIIETGGVVLIAALAVALAQREGGLAQASPIIGAMALGAVRLLPYLQQLYHAWATFAGSRAGTSQVLAFLELPMAEQDSEPPQTLSFRKAIRLEDVSFRYSAGRIPALAGIDLTIPAGARVALVGRSGSGKSTLADLLMGLLEPDGGHITVDGEPLGAGNRRAWRQSIAHVPQTIFLADATIASNIALGLAPSQIDPERLARAVRIAQLDEVIAGLPQGLDTQIGERGVRLSGGQRQRLGIARAIYKDAPVLVLDEATNALDEATESAVLDGLDQFAGKERTLIIITHRASTIVSCDLVVRLNEGRIEPAAEVRGPTLRSSG